MRRKFTEEENIIRRREAVQRYRSRNRERLNELQKQYRLRPGSKERHRIQAAKWRRANPEKSLEISRKNFRLHGSEHNQKRKARYHSDVEYRGKKLAADKNYNASGKRKLAWDTNPNKNAILKRRWQRIKNGNYEKVKAKMKKYREDVLIEKEREAREKLSDQYVIYVIKKQTKYQIATEDIPKELIEAKRTIIKIKRLKIQNNETRTHL